MLEEQGVFAPDIVQNIPDEYLRGAIREEGCPGKPQGAQYRRRASTNILRDLDLPLETSDIRRAPRGLGHNSGRMATEGAKPLREKVGSTGQEAVVNHMQAILIAVMYMSPDFRGAQGFQNWIVKRPPRLIHCFSGSRIYSEYIRYIGLVCGATVTE